MAHVDVDWLSKEAVSLAEKSSATPRYPCVVGGSGLLGSNLTVLLARTPGCERVLVIDMRPPSDEILKAAPNVQFVKHRLGGAHGDDEEALKENEKNLLSALEGIDCVFSTVTPHVQHASQADFVATNEKGVQCLVDACLKKGVPRLVHLSSIAVTSHFIDSIEQTEEDPLPSMDMYESPYDITKRRGEDSVLAANNAGTFATCSIRASGIILSPWDFVFCNFWPTIPGLIIQPCGKKIDFIDGRDVCCAMLMAAQALQERPEEVAGESFFVTKGGAKSPGEVGRYAAKQLCMPFVHIPDWVISIAYYIILMVHTARGCLGFAVPGIPPHRFIMMLYSTMTFDNSKAHKVLGWSPKVSVDEATERVVAMYQQQKGPSSRPVNMLFSNVFGLVLLLSLVPIVVPAALYLIITALVLIGVIHNRPTTPFSFATPGLRFGRLIA